MRTALLTAAFCLMGTFAASADLPITYVGRPEMHRFDGSVRQVTLVLPHVEQAKVLVGELCVPPGSPEYSIHTGAFLKEPLPKERLAYLAESISVEKLSEDLPQRMQQWHEELRRMSF